jgi:predicted RNA-binding protein with PIN domain
VTERAEESTATEEPPPSLSEPVRTRVVAIAADALGRVAPENLPPALKRVAAFAPARRARLAASQIAGVLETDELFRERLAAQVRADAGELATALADGRPPAAGDPVEVAATAYLLRSPGWREVVATAEAAVRAEREVAGARQTDEQVERLRRRVTELQDEAQELRQRAKEQVDRLKVENAELRRKLGDARSRLRDTERDAEATRAEAAEVVRVGEQSVASSAAEVRRLRTRVSELEAELATARRTERAAKVGETVRARLLVDTLVSAAQGLQRELALPASDRLPADMVAAHEAEHGSRTSSGRGSLPVDDPGLLEELLRLPRAHLVVDGYNVTKNAWPELPLERQRDRLLTGAAHLLARTGAEITVVFDAAETRNRPLVTPPRGVRVLFSPYGVIADDVIRDLVAAEPPGRGVVVASSDQAVARDVVAAGFRVVASAALVQLLTR